MTQANRRLEVEPLEPRQGPYRSLRGCAIAAAAILLIGVGVVAWLCDRWDGVVCDGKQPMMAAEIRKYFSPGVPDSAGNIRYAAWRQGVGLMEFVKFEAPAADCIAHAKRCLAAFNAENPDSRINETLRPITGWEERLRHTAPLDVPWFDPSSIRTGLVGGEDAGYRPLVWIDTEKGVFYWQLAD